MVLTVEDIRAIALEVWRLNLPLPPQLFPAEDLYPSATLYPQG